MKIECAYDELVDLHKLQPNPINPNKHPEKQIKMLAKIIDYQGQRSPIVVSNRSGFITKGHGRLEAIKQLGWTSAAVDFQDYESEAQEYADIIADNKIAELAQHDDGMMISSLKELEMLDMDLELLGLDDFEIPLETDQAKEAIEDDVPTDVDTRCKPGDLWILGEHRLLCGDSTNIQHVERLMGGEKADMVFTDPPYGINEKGDRGQRFGKDSILQKGEVYKDFKDDSIQYAIDAWNICDSLKIPRQIWWGANYYCHSIPQTNNWIIWDKRVEDKQTDLNSDAELAWVKSKWSSVRIFRHLWKGLIKQSERSEKRVHPTQKPIALAEWCFDYYKDSFKNVLDLFGGSGSTLIACEKTNRKCFMMELDPHYCDVILTRWEKYSGKTATLSKA